MARCRCSLALLSWPSGQYVKGKVKIKSMGSPNGRLASRNGEAMPVRHHWPFNSCRTAEAGDRRTVRQTVTCRSLANRGPMIRSPRATARTRCDELVGRSLLEQEPGHPGPQGRLQVAGHVQPGQDQHPAAGQPSGQLPGSGNAVGARQRDVQQCHVRPVFQRGGHDLVTAGQRGGHLDVLLKAEQGGQRLPHHSHVLGDQHPDHRAVPTNSGVGLRLSIQGDAGTGVPSILGVPSIHSVSLAPAIPVTGARHEVPVPARA